MLSELYFPLSITGLTETKLKIDQEEIFYINIPSYNFLSRPSLSNAAGVGVFVKNGISHSCCQDPSLRLRKDMNPYGLKSKMMLNIIAYVELYRVISMVTQTVS